MIERDVPPPAQVVELGVAPGDQAAALARAGYEVTAVDIGTAADAWGDGEEGRMVGLLARSGVHPVQCDLEDTPYPLADGSFDVVVMTEVYEHSRGYPVRSLAEVAQILRPGGRLYFTTPNAAYLINRLRLLTGRSPATPLPDWIAGLPHARHAREHPLTKFDTFSHVGPEAQLVTRREFTLEMECAAC